MRPQIGPPALADELRAVAADPSAAPGARADAVALLLGDVEKMSGKARAADAARTVIGRIAGKVRWAAAALKRFVTRSNPRAFNRRHVLTHREFMEYGGVPGASERSRGRRATAPREARAAKRCGHVGRDGRECGDVATQAFDAGRPEWPITFYRCDEHGHTRSNPRFKKWKPPLLPGAPELKLVRVSAGLRALAPYRESADIAKAFAFISLSHREAVWIGLLDGKHRLAGIYMHTLGGTNSSHVYPSEILRVVLHSGMSLFVMVHNHPSGDPSPSADDIAITDRVNAACELLGNMRCLDSLVISHDGSRNGTALRVFDSSAHHDGPAQFVMEDSPEDGTVIRYTSMADSGLMRS